MRCLVWTEFTYRLIHLIFGSCFYYKSPTISLLRLLLFLFTFSLNVDLFSFSITPFKTKHEKSQHASVYCPNNKSINMHIMYDRSGAFKLHNSSLKH
jgi:hypothetical protein